MLKKQVSEFFAAKSGLNVGNVIQLRHPCVIYLHIHVLKKIYRLTKWDLDIH